MKMRLLIAYFFLLFSCVSVFASEKDTLNVYYSVNQSFVDIVDSISCVQKKLNIKNSFQKQDFYVFFTRKSDGVFMYITHCRLFEDEYGSKYVPFGCVVKNDSFFTQFVKKCTVMLHICFFFRNFVPNFIKTNIQAK